MTTQADTTTAPVTTSRPAPTKLATAVWAVLLTVSLLGVLNHAMGAFAFASSGNESLMFAAFAGVNLYAAAVLLRPYRRGGLWAWLATWSKLPRSRWSTPSSTTPGWAPAIWSSAIWLALAQVASFPWFRSA